MCLIFKIIPLKNLFLITKIPVFRGFFKIFVNVVVKWKNVCLNEYNNSGFGGKSDEFLKFPLSAENIFSQVITI